MRRCVNASKVRSAKRPLLSLSRRMPFSRVETPGNSSAVGQNTPSGFTIENLFAWMRSGTSFGRLAPFVGWRAKEFDRVADSPPRRRGWLGVNAMGRRYTRTRLGGTRGRRGYLA